MPGAKALWREIEALDNQVPAAVQTRLLLDLSRLLERAARRLLQLHLPAMMVGERVAELAPGVERVAELLPRLLESQGDQRYRERVDEFAGQGISPELAKRAALFQPLITAIDIVQVAGTTECPVDCVCGVYFGKSGVRSHNAHAGSPRFKYPKIFPV